MEKGFFVGIDKEAAKRVFDAFTDPHAEQDRTNRTIENYSARYQIDGEVATIDGRRIHVDYLPTLDAMLEAKGKYENALEVIGAALYKIEVDHCIFLTERNDPNLERVYQANSTGADEMADRLWKLTTEEYEHVWTHVIAKVLSGSFEVAFGQFLGNWRRSLTE